MNILVHPLHNPRTPRTERARPLIFTKCLLKKSVNIVGAVHCVRRVHRKRFFADFQIYQLTVRLYGFIIFSCIMLIGFYFE